MTSRLLFVIATVCVCLSHQAAWPQQAYNGSTGYINTHSAHALQDGDFVAGYSYAKPYSYLYVTSQVLPRLQVSGRFAQVHGIRALSDDYGWLKDKSIAAKLQLVPSDWLGISYFPAVAVGFEDAFIGTQLYSTYFAVASRKSKLLWGDLDWSLGYGQKRISGGFAGLRYSHPKYSNWYWLTDFDQINFSQDPYGNLVGLDKRKTGQFNHAIEYQSKAGWSLQLGRRDGGVGLNLSLNAPLGKKTLQPKTEEPAPYISFSPRPTEVQWQSEPTVQATMVRLLYEAGFREVGISYDGAALKVGLASVTYIESSRAVGRAARIVLAHAPQNVQRLEVTLKHQGLGVLQYQFSDLKKLKAYFDGAISLRDAERTVRIVQVDDKGVPAAMSREALRKMLGPQEKTLATSKTDKSIVGLATGKWSGENVESGHSWGIGPRVQIYFNDPSGAIKAALGVEVSGQYKHSPSLHLDAAVGVRLLENITDVTQPSNSVLPHVRTDVAEYFKGSKTKVERLVINKFGKPSSHWYSRVSAGAYETMFAGAGGQLMYVPESGKWSVDFTLDRLAQRDFASAFKLQDYQVTTGFISTHMRLPMDMTFTARLGQFLAKDRGARFELKRQLNSGVEFGAWYSVTNGRDITSPGSPTDPYMDKGVFMSIPLDVISTRHTQRVVNMSLSPWTRDIGQMVKSPADLRGLFERGLLNTLSDKVPLRSLGGVDADDAY
jgi:Exopolysaccharide biosynthesis protein YbjH